mgnify:CR=1 FL=1
MMCCFLILIGIKHLFCCLQIKESCEKAVLLNMKGKSTAAAAKPASEPAKAAPAAAKPAQDKLAASKPATAVGVYLWGVNSWASAGYKFEIEI